MSITLKEYPNAGVELVLQALDEMAPVIERPELGGSIKNEISEPIAVYILDLEDASKGELPKHMVPAGFRYLVFSGDQVLAADITADKDGNQAGEFNRITSGPIVDRFNKALAYVDKNFADTETDFELRALEVPAVNEAAIWLKSSLVDVFVPYLDRDRLKGKAISESQGFIAEMAEHAAQIRRDGSN